MIRLEKLHESESFEIRLEKPIAGKAVIAYFKGIGASLEDDFILEDRKDTVPPWQTSSIYTVECSLSGVAVYPDESQVDCLTFDYLFSSLPARFYPRFAEVLQRSAEQFDGSIYYDARVISPRDMNPLFDSWVSDLRDEISEEPGTESLSILIEELFYQ
jgi:hypothetical protein